MKGTIQRKSSGSHPHSSEHTQNAYPQHPSHQTRLQNPQQNRNQHPRNTSNNHQGDTATFTDTNFLNSNPHLTQTDPFPYPQTPSKEPQLGRITTTNYTTKARNSASEGTSDPNQSRSQGSGGSEEQKRNSSYINLRGQSLKSGQKMAQKLPKILVPNWVLLLSLLCLITINVGTYYGHNIVQLLEEHIEILFDKSQKSIVHLYTNYYLFSTPMVLAAGFLVTWFGASNIALVLTFLLLTDSILMYLGVSRRQFGLVVASRSLDGLCYEANEIAQFTLISTWFKGRFLSLAVGMVQFANNLGSVVSTLLAIRVFKATRSIDLVFFIAGCVAVFSAVAVIVFYTVEIFVNSKIRKFEEKVEEEAEKDVIRCSMWSDLNNKLTWVTTANAAISLSIYPIFMTFVVAFVKNRFSYTLDETTWLVAVITISYVLGIPLYSSISVKFGKKMPMLCVAYLAVISSFGVMFVLPSRRKSTILYIIFIIIGQFQAVVTSVIWSSLALVTPSRAEPLVFGVSQFLTNLLISFFSYVIGLIVEFKNLADYQAVLLILVFYGCIGLIVAFLNYQEDMKRGGILMFPENGTEVFYLKSMIDRGEYEDLEEEEMRETEAEIEDEMRARFFDGSDEERVKKVEERLIADAEQ